MTESTFSPLPLDFHARIPCDAAFASIVMELTGRLAKVAGFDDARSAAIGREVGEAFSQTLQRSTDGPGAMELALRVTAEAYGATVTCGTTELLDLRWPRPV